MNRKFKRGPLMESILSGVPYYFVVWLFSKVLLLAVFSLINLSSAQANIVSLFCFFVSWCCVRKAINSFEIKDIKFFDVLILGAFVSLVISRFMLYFPSFDDIAYHFIVGDYSRTLWSVGNFMPMGMATYLYPVYQLIYTPLLGFFGLRLALLIVNLVLTTWYFSIYLRSKLALGEKKGPVLAVLFSYFFFVPHLMATHVTFMVDFVALVLLLEFFYQLMFTKNKTFAFAVAILFLVVKQSAGIFVVPFILWQFVLNIKKINIKILVGLLAIISIYFIRCWIDTGNPLSFLYNSVFKSPLYDLTTFKDTRWGPLTWWENLLWPIIGQFTNRYGEGLIHWQSKVYFSLFSSVPYLYSFYKVFIKREIKYGVIIVCYLLWTVVFAYSRYQIPMSAMFWLWIIKENNFDISFMSGFVKKIVVIIILILNFNSIGVDFSWRPPIFNRDYIPVVKSGIKLVGKDRIGDIVGSVNDQVMERNDVLVSVGRGPQTLYLYLAYKNGKKILDHVDKKKFESILVSDKISPNIKKTLSVLNESKQVLLITENKELDSAYLIDYGFRCDYVDEIGPNRYFQNGYCFTSIYRYECQKI